MCHDTGDVVQQLRQRLLYYYALAKDGRASPNRSVLTRLLALEEHEEHSFVGTLDGLSCEAVRVKATVHGATIETVADTMFRAEIAEVFAYWRLKTGRSIATKLLPRRAARIRARLREGYTAAQLKQAIDGCLRSPFHQGDNKQHVKYDRIKVIFRDGGQVEHFASLCDRSDREATRRTKGVRLPD